MHCFKGKPCYSVQYYPLRHFSAVKRPFSGVKKIQEVCVNAYTYIQLCISNTNVCTHGCEDVKEDMCICVCMYIYIYIYIYIYKLKFLHTFQKISICLPFVALQTS